MSTRFTCDDTETLVAYIYDEADPATRDGVARHLVECARCRDEIAALGGVRRALAQWAPPAPPLRFSIVQAELPPAQTSNQVVRPRVAAWQTAPVWAQVAAATLAVAVGAAIANVQVRHDVVGWTVSTGWMTPATPAADRAVADESWRSEVAALAQSVRDLEGRQATAAATPVSMPAPAGADADTLARVRALIEASERRQQQELALRLTQFNRDFDMQRRADLVRIDQGIGELEGRTGAEVARQRQMLDLIVRAGLRAPQ
ncbi:MAG TPA: zf-HC2 domain-containing protein [Vicinamibacterales bacterium]|nr:zf-HC2 domain-containing protein [Vicinamibacterales bacterium]